MNNWIKIESDVFFIKEVSIQLSVGSHASVDISFDRSLYPDYESIFFKKYEDGRKFSIIGKTFESKGSLIKSIDIDTHIINLSIRCDILNPINTSERRDEIIEEVLNNKDKNNIK